MKEGKETERLEEIEENAYEAGKAVRQVAIAGAAIAAATGEAAGEIGGVVGEKALDVGRAAMAGASTGAAALVDQAAKAKDPLLSSGAAPRGCSGAGPRCWLGRARASRRARPLPARPLPARP